MVLTSPAISVDNVNPVLWVTLSEELGAMPWCLLSSDATLTAVTHPDSYSYGLAVKVI